MVLVSRNLSSFTCVEASISPISSKNKVPPFADSKRPIRRSDAPVNAPFSCPNISLSSKFAGKAAQCTGQMGLSIVHYFDGLLEQIIPFRFPFLQTIKQLLLRVQPGELFPEHFQEAIDLPIIPSNLYFFSTL